MALLPTNTVVRDILTADLTLSADEVIRLAKAKGVKGTDSEIRTAVHNVRSELKKKAARSATGAARTTTPPAPVAPIPAPVVPAPVVPAPAVAPLTASTDLASVLANVALVNAVIGVCGGVESTRKAAEAVRSCGGVAPFLMHLELVASIRTPAAG